MSEYTRNRIVMKSTNKNIVTVYSGYNSKKYYLRNIKKDKYSIIFVGNLKKRKGLKILCQSLSNLPKDVKDKLFIRLVGVFNRPDFDKFDKLLKLNNIRYKIHSNINDNDLSILFNKSTVNVLPSISDEFYYEGFVFNFY